MAQETKLDVKEILIRLAKLQSDVEYIKSNIGTDKNLDWSDCSESYSNLDMNFRLVMDHEIGHVLGFGHDDDPNSIMFGRPFGNLSVSCKGSENWDYHKPNKK